MKNLIILVFGTLLVSFSTNGQTLKVYCDPYGEVLQEKEVHAKLNDTIDVVAQAGVGGECFSKWTSTEGLLYEINNEGMNPVGWYDGEGSEDYFHFNLSVNADLDKRVFTFEKDKAEEGCGQEPMKICKIKVLID